MHKKITLENGLRIILVPQPGNLAVTVSVLVEAGSKYETKEINGISHFLEHMVFKGTQKRPSTLAISSELDGIGASYNAFTSHEVTGYWAKARTSHFEKILDVVSDIYLNPLFDGKEIDKERGVIIEEINLIEDQPSSRVWDVFLDLLYGDQPAGWRILGPKENIQKITREDFLNYRNNHYLPKSTIITIAGNFNEQKAVDEVKKHFSDFKTGEKTSKIKVIESQSQPRVSVKYKDSDQTHLVLGFRAFGVFDDRRYPLGILSDILGGSMSSRLWQKVREQMGAAYYVRAGTDLLTDHGFFAVSAGVGNEKFEPVLRAILEELKKIKEEGVSSSELDMAKEHIIGKLTLGLETSDELAGFYGEQEILERKIETPEEIIKKIEAVKESDIISVAKDIFQNNKMNLALIGPFKKEEEQKFKEILKI